MCQDSEQYTPCILAQPVMSRRDSSVLLGVIEFVNKRGGVYDEDDKHVIELLASMTSAAIEIVRQSSQKYQGSHKATQTVVVEERCAS